jgi:uncharacterized protein YprB with RNaseH-like and TPR domain
MLTRTFCHIPGIGEKGERELWEAGVYSWNDVVDGKAERFSPYRREALARGVRESVARFAAADARYFAGLLPSHQLWRLFPEFRRATAYIDIETNGLWGPRACITTIAVYSDDTIRYYVKDRNLHEFTDDILGYRIIATYNGTCFDLPFIRDYLGVTIDLPHIDLRYVLGRLGYKGGLKNIERRFGIDRGELDGIDGYFAVLLWRDYLLNDNQKALETLLAYNIQDVLSLESLMTISYNLHLQHTPFSNSGKLATTAVPVVPFEVDHGTVRRLKRYNRKPG